METGAIIYMVVVIVVITAVAIRMKKRGLDKADEASKNNGNTEGGDDNAD